MNKNNEAVTSRNCHVCNSDSTILDNHQWVCAQHIEHCKCKKNHELSASWDFNEGEHEIPITVKDMEDSMPEIGIPNGRGGYLR